MISYYNNFYKDLFQRTSGFLPIWPLKQEVQLGDILLIRSGKMIPLGNINDPFFGVGQDIRLTPVFHPMAYLWQTEFGIRISQQTQAVLYNESEEPQGRQQILLEFDHPGSYFFRAQGIRYQSIENFWQFQFKLLQQLASEKFNFKELYIISSVAQVDSYALSVAAESPASVTINVSSDYEGLVSFDDLCKEGLEWKLENMQGMHQLHISESGGPLFFKAYKLEVSHKGKDRILKYIRELLPDSFQKYTSNIITYCPSEILPSIEIYPANVHEIFHFREINLDDLALFFGE